MWKGPPTKAAFFISNAVESGRRFLSSRLIGSRRGAGNPFFNQEVALKDLVAKFFADSSGATAIEYGLIAAGIALAIIAAVNGLGTNLNAKFTNINSSLN